MNTDFKQAAELLKNSKHAIVFTGAGISVESGIPPFRGEGGVWNQYDPSVLELSYFLKHPEISWPVLKKLFYDLYGQAKPNEAHYALARLQNLVKTIITQNIDNDHLAAGSQNVYEFHGTLRTLVCLECGTEYLAQQVDFNETVPRCQKDNGLLKPNFRRKFFRWVMKKLPPKILFYLEKRSQSMLLFNLLLKPWQQMSCC